MSDVQCAARVVVVADAPGMLESLRAEHPAAVHAAPGRHEPAARVAAALRVPRRDLPAESAPEGLETVLLALSDEYRGECVVVLVTPATLVELARRHVGRRGEGSGLVVEIDADGQRWARLSAAPE